MPGRKRGRPPHPDVLTPAEWAVLDGLRHGMSRRQIAARTGVSSYAIRYHARNIARKIGAAGVPELRYWPGIPAASVIGTRRWEDVMETGPAARAGAVPGPLGQVSLLVRDIGRAEAFYRDRLALPHLFTFGDLAFFGCGGTRLFLRQVPEGQWQPGSILYFAVPDIHTSYRDLGRRGVVFDGAPHLIHRHADGTEEWMAFFSDGEGNTLALMSQVPPTGPARTG
jgi:DNA-binding CsgD family transcriptional regulator/catechol 2,3-dioxygenase-like lactoylglutathione lyase family enzyme